MGKHLQPRARRTKAHLEQLQQQQQKASRSGHCSFDRLLRIFFLTMILVMNVLCAQYWNQVKAEQALMDMIDQEHDANAQDYQQVLDLKHKTTTTSDNKVRSGKVEIGTTTAAETEEDAIPTTHHAAASDIGSTSFFPNSHSRSKNVTCDAYAHNFLSQSHAKEIIHKYATEVVAISQRPRFVPVLLALMNEAVDKKEMFFTVQLGGMDGYTGDPFYRMIQLYKKPLQNWLPIVVEPVPRNFVRLVATYQQHKQNLQLPCAHLLEQLVNYDPKQESKSGICGFCHFDESSTKCDHIPSWQKHEVGSMECDRKGMECFVRSEFYCGKIGQAMEAVHLHPSQVAVLQIDVEGFELQVLTGYFSEIDDAHLPPVINFENKILKGRHQLDPLYALLRSKGYSLHEKRTDTLCLLGYQGDTFLDKK